jgi:hypothetical protein
MIKLDWCDDVNCYCGKVAQGLNHFHVSKEIWGAFICKTNDGKIFLILKRGREMVDELVKSKASKMTSQELIDYASKVIVKKRMIERINECK